ncbi:glutamyl-tRNA reductase [Flavobacterium sp. DG2-3]|uniref:glutamyl-tRNA reductase n=1 Tax=Flavobacterium sp. DG2-3 TaxID=3068317 RepID=UPI00273DD629|nr:glutamyl-tRNA reductase [Flavobacterium sp. DG2-3]MDP5200272.1 glutamyl-tRNA reductase [Flavobacterium sp. DG2-3]
MENLNLSKNTTFYALGLSYKKADALIRGKFSLDPKGQSDLLAQAKAEGIDSLIVISTCNRTEIYGSASHPYELIKLLCSNTEGSVEEFQQACYIYKNKDAVNHFFRVGAGLDSQILGDFEIISQIKTSLSNSKSHGLVNTFLDRLANAVIQASKKIKTDTGISSGAASVSFSAVRYIIENVQQIGSKKILLLGTGDIGRNTCENLIKHTKNGHVTVINRTKSKAQALAGKLNVIVRDYNDLQHELQQSDVVVVATGADHPTVCSELLNLIKPLLILDLSIPRNVNPDVEKLPGVRLIHMDYLSQMKDETLEKRKQHIPAAEAIIEEVKLEFNTWVQTRKYAPAIHALKSKLNDIAAGELAFQKKKSINFDQAQADEISSRIINKITSHFAGHLKNEDCSIDESIKFIEKVFQLGEYEPLKKHSPIEEKYKINLS